MLDAASSWTDTLLVSLLFLLLLSVCAEEHKHQHCCPHLLLCPPALRSHVYTATGPTINTHSAVLTTNKSWFYGFSFFFRCCQHTTDYFDSVSSSSLSLSAGPIPSSPLSPLLMPGRYFLLFSGSIWWIILRGNVSASSSRRHSTTFRFVPKRLICIQHLGTDLASVSSPVSLPASGPFHFTKGFFNYTDIILQCLEQHLEERPSFYFVFVGLFVVVCMFLFHFFKDGESVLNPEKNKEPCSFPQGASGVFIAKHSQTTLHVHLTDSPAFNLFVYLVFFGGGREVNPRAEMWISLCPFTKVLHRLLNRSFVPCFFLFVVVVRQHGIMTLAKWRWKSK